MRGAALIPLEWAVLHVLTTLLRAHRLPDLIDVAGIHQVNDLQAMLFAHVRIKQLQADAIHHKDDAYLDLWRHPRIAQRCNQGEAQRNGGGNHGTGAYLP